MIALCAALFAAGHILRDGWPSFKDVILARWPNTWVWHLSTQWARISGALLCGLGAYPIGGAIFAAAVWASVLAGFYVDMKHGEGQGADNFTSVEYLLLSGITSVIPLAVTLVLLNTTWGFLMVFVGIAKPPIWLLSWLGLRRFTDTWFQPTRIAAGLFGAVIGAAVAVIDVYR